MTELNIEFTLSISDEDIDDIVCTALEGGITYWCREARVVGDYLGEYASEQISRGGELILVDSESDDEYTLTKQKLLNGIRLAIYNHYYEDYKWWNSNGIETCNVDADVADVIIQLALFEDIIYG